MFSVAGDVPGLHWRRRLVTQHLLDRPGNQRRVGNDLPALVRVVGQQLADEPDQPGCRFGAGTGDRARIGEDLRAGQLPAPAVRFLDFRVEQLGHQIVRRVLRAPFDVVDKHLIALLERVGRDLPQGAVFQSQKTVGVVADGGLVGLRDAEEIADRAHGHPDADVGDEVEALRADEWIEHPRTVLAHKRFDRFHAPRRENPRQQPSMQIVQWRIFEQNHTGRDFDPVEDDVQDGALTRAIGFPVGQFPGHVRIPAQRKEVVLVVEVQRRLIPQPLPCGVRIVVDREVERVVVHVDRTGIGHGHALLLGNLIFVPDTVRSCRPVCQRRSPRTP